MGHGFGLPHSSGPYGATYDSRWDVMSNVWGNCSPPDPNYGCVGVHTISYHKDRLGWIPPSRKFVPLPGSSQTITIERLGQPVSGSNYLMAQIPIGGSTTQFYTIEARRFAGYDIQIPGEAIVIHRVDTTRGDRLAQVVDTDDNGDPNDAGAMWIPGDTFVDTANRITVSVNRATTTGFEVTISFNATFRLSVSVKGKGTVTGPGINCRTNPRRDPTGCTEAYNAGAGVTLTATPDSRFRFARWQGACAGQGNPCSLTMTNNKSVTALFKRSRR